MMYQPPVIWGFSGNIDNEEVITDFSSVGVHLTPL